MSRMLPYPGRYESWSSWDFRCRQWENNRRDYQRQLKARQTNWGGYHYYQTKNFDTPVEQEIDGKIYLVMKRGYGWRSSCVIERFAQKHGLSFKRFNGNGLHGICERIDGIAYKNPQLDLVYSNDDH